MFTRLRDLVKTANTFSHQLSDQKLIPQRMALGCCLNHFSDQILIKSDGQIKIFYYDPNEWYSPYRWELFDHNIFPYVNCHGKTCLKVFVVVVPKEGLAGPIPKEGLTGGALPILLLVWHRLQDIICEGSRVQFYSRCHTQRSSETQVIQSSQVIQ